MKRIIVLAAGVAALAAVWIAAPASAQASSGRDGVRAIGTCTGASKIKLKLGFEDTGIRVQLEVEGPAGAQWALALSDNGVPFFGRTKTANLLGVVRVRRLIPDQPGPDVVSATARDIASGEHCAVSATI